jgi:hypothetical protein
MVANVKCTYATAIKKDETPESVVDTGGTLKWGKNRAYVKLRKAGVPFHFHYLPSGSMYFNRRKVFHMALHTPVRTSDL